MEAVFYQPASFVAGYWLKAQLWKRSWQNNPHIGGLIFHEVAHRAHILPRNRWAGRIRPPSATPWQNMVSKNELGISRAQRAAPRVRRHVLQARGRPAEGSISRMRRHIPRASGHPTCVIMSYGHGDAPRKAECPAGAGMSRAHRDILQAPAYPTSSGRPACAGISYVDRDTSGAPGRGCG